MRDNRAAILDRLRMKGQADEASVPPGAVRYVRASERVDSSARVDACERGLGAMDTSARGRVRSWGRTFIFPVFAAMLGFASLASAGCGPQIPADIHGLEAVPSGYALVVEGRAAGSNPRTVHALIIPEKGLFRMQLEGLTYPGEMLFTVRTPEKQAGYRGQAVLEGRPRDLDMAFLDSPLTYPREGAKLVGVARNGDHLSAVVRRGSEGACEELEIEAEIDPATGIVVWERWLGGSPYGPGNVEITRSLVPLSLVEMPDIAEVYEFGRADWDAALGGLAGLGYDVYGVEHPRLMFHTLQCGDGEAWLRYSATAQPGRVAVEIHERPLSSEKWWEDDYATGWTPCLADDGHTPGHACLFVRGDRAVFVNLYDWALNEIPLTTAEVEAALVPVRPDSAAGAEAPPVIPCDGPMPLPSDSDFGQLLSARYR